MRRTSSTRIHLNLARSLLALSLLGISAPLVEAQGVPPAATNCTDDTAGANDQPNQKDLTQYCIDPPSGDFEQITLWNWDDTGLSGNNTGDACSLYDTDGDGNANLAVCVTIEKNPATMKAGSPRLFTCGDTRPDRCTSSVLVPTGNTFCAVTQQDTDPFPTGDFSPTDTEARCAVDLNDFGAAGTGGVLIDVCSYPSTIPNSAPSDCVEFRPCSNPSQCDDGASCTTDTCDPATGGCTNTPNNGVCNDGQVCTGEETCNPDDPDANATTGCVPGVPPLNCCVNNDECDNEELCDGTETCVGNACVPGTPPDCADGVACTTDACVPGIGCTHAPEDDFCDDDEVCTGTETCDPVRGCVPGTPPENCCETDADCDDEDVCTGTETCFENQCQPGTPEVCDDGKACTGTECDPVDGCTFEADDTVCDDANFCTGEETCDPTHPNADARGCVPGTAPENCCLTNADCKDTDVCDGEETCSDHACQPGTPLPCDDGKSCTTDGCDPLGGCFNNPLDAACDDGNVCTGIETCDPEAKTANDITGCVPGTPVPDCCLTDEECDDQDICTGPETCEANACTNGDDLDCDDKATCSTDECGEGGCQNTPDDKKCDDGNPCTGVETCQPGNDDRDPVTGCVPGTPRENCCVTDAECGNNDVCDGIERCVNNTCQPGTPETCNDNNACNGVETCDPLGGCQAGTPVVCSALDQCHDVGTCDPATGTCSNPNKADGSTCNDGDACTQTDTCQGGTCGGANPVVCSALDQCHDAGTCDPATGTCSNPNKADGSTCNDGNACTLDDVCGGGQCGGTTRDCDDGNVCTDDGCDPATGCTNPNNTEPCDDGEFCNGEDNCVDGECQHSGDPCDDEISCTVDSCDPVLGCVNNPDDSQCDDDNACTFDSCDPEEGCVHIPQKVSASDSRAYGLSLGLLGTDLILPIPDTDDANPQNQTPQIAVPPLASVKLLSVAANESSNDQGASSSAVAQTAEVKLLNLGLLGAPLITVKAVRAQSTCNATEDGASCSSAGSTLANVKIGGKNYGDITSPTVIPLKTGLVDVTVALLEHVGTGSNAGEENPTINTAGLTVNAIHVFGKILGGQLVDITIAHAEANAMFGNAQTCVDRPVVSGEAFVVGLKADETILDPAGVLLDGKVIDVVLPSSGGNVDGNLANVFLGQDANSHVLSSGTDFSHTDGTVNVGANTAASKSHAQVEDLSVLAAGVPPANPLISADLVRAECNAGATTAGAASFAKVNLVDLSVAGIEICDALMLNPLCNPAPNTDVLGLPIGTVIRLNEQKCDNGGSLASNCADGTVPGHTGITVNAVHVFVLGENNPLGLPVLADLIVSSAHCDAGAVPPAAE